MQLWNNSLSLRLNLIVFFIFFISVWTKAKKYQSLVSDLKNLATNFHAVWLLDVLQWLCITASFAILTTGHSVRCTIISSPMCLWHAFHMKYKHSSDSENKLMGCCFFFFNAVINLPPPSPAIHVQHHFTSAKSWTSSTFRCLGGVPVRTLDIWSRGHLFYYQSGRYQVVTTWMGDCG